MLQHDIQTVTVCKCCLLITEILIPETGVVTKYYMYWPEGSVVILYHSPYVKYGDGLKRFKHLAIRE